MEELLVPISALQHYAYCPRQCALIHIEQTFEENIYTLRGRRVHDKVDQPEGEWNEGVRIERALPLYSQKLGLVGKGDVVEFDENGVPHPVEYKSGPRKSKKADSLQLCAQGMCLEEMMGKPVEKGSLYYAKSRRRQIVEFTSSLRQEVEEIVGAVRNLLQSTILPPPVADSRCTHCSLIEACMPFVLKEFEQNSKKISVYKVEEL